jgi:hypothetical protein
LSVTFSNHAFSLILHEVDDIDFSKTLNLWKDNGETMFPHKIAYKESYKLMGAQQEPEVTKETWKDSFKVTGTSGGGNPEARALTIITISDPTVLSTTLRT